MRYWGCAGACWEIASVSGPKVSHQCQICLLSLTLREIEMDAMIWSSKCETSNATEHKSILKWQTCKINFKKSENKTCCYISSFSRSSWALCTSTSRGSTSSKRMKTTLLVPRTQPTVLTSSTRRPSSLSPLIKTTRYHTGTSQLSCQNLYYVFIKVWKVTINYI